MDYLITFRGKTMKQETISKRIDNAIRRYIPNESDKVKQYIKDLILITFRGLQEEAEIDERTGKAYSDTRNLDFAISITLDDTDTKMILEEARKETSK